MWPSGLSESPLFQPPPPQADDRPPLEFEFVDLAEDREEEPVSDEVPLSDLDRRAHGGEGEAAEVIGVVGVEIGFDGAAVGDRHPHRDAVQLAVDAIAVSQLHFDNAGGFFDHHDLTVTGRIKT